MRPNYSFKIHYRIVRGSEREKKVLELAKEYGLEPGCRLVDRLVEDRYLIIQERAGRKAEALRKREEAEKELRTLVAGDK